jgi:membrane protease YdiL (CAAX protease family)
MTENDATAEHPILERRPGTAWTALVAWAVILVVVLFVFVRQRQQMAQAEQTTHDTSFQRNLIELQGRQSVGFKAIGGRGHQLLEQAKALDRGSFRQRLRFAVLAGELAGPKKALERLNALEPPDSQTDASAAEDRKLYDDLRRLYSAYANKEFDPAEILPEEERDRLRKELGWFGDLALAPERGPDKEARRAIVAPARRKATGFLIGFFTILGLAAVGFVALVALVILLSMRPWLRGFVPGSPSGVVYVETFALWLVLFVAVSLGGSKLLPGVPPLLRSALLFLLTLVVLAWPVWRGVPWRQVRRDVGLYSGRGLVVEVLSGLATYVMALPLLIGGLLALLVFSYLLRRSGGGGLFDNGAPAHPIVGVAPNDWWVCVQVVLAASVAAPIVEETMFRGVFYRHLREATRGGSFFLSVLASGLVSSLIFAVIHPQGALAVPVLTGLAFGFAIGREWRSSLLSCMVAHGVHNGLLVLFLLTSLSR